MVTLAALIFIAAIFLLRWHFFSPETKDFFDEENKKNENNK